LREEIPQEPWLDRLYIKRPAESPEYNRRCSLISLSTAFAR